MSKDIRTSRLARVVASLGTAAIVMTALAGSVSAVSPGNDDIANPGVRVVLFTRPNNITPYEGLELPTGQVGDEGLFWFTAEDPQVSLQNGATFTTGEFIFAEGDAADENNLDKIAGVAPLRFDDIYNLEGASICAVVYDSDISINYDPLHGNLKGATLGLTAFDVTSVRPHPAGGSYLPLITITLLTADDCLEVCRAFP